MRVGLRTRIFAAGTAIVLLVSAVFAILLASIGDLRDSAQKAQHSEQVLAAANNLETVVLDLETGARGFVITRQESFLEPWTSGLAAFPRDGAALERLVIDNPEQEARAKAIVREGNLYISAYSRPLIALARRGSPQAGTLVATGVGKRRVDAIRGRLNSFATAENLLLVSRRSRASSSARRATELGVGGLIGASLLVLLFGGFLGRAIVTPVRRVSAAAARLAGGDLSARVVDGGAGEVAELGRSFNTMASAISRDVDARVQAAREKEQLESQLRQSQKMEAIGSLAGGVAHDFNNLLTVIRGYTSVVMERNVDESLTEGLQHVDDAAGRAAELTRQLLAFSRQQVLRPEATSLNEVVADTLKLLARLIGTDIEIASDLEPALPPIVVDRGQLGQVILNLAVNAREAMPDGGRLLIRTTTSASARLTSRRTRTSPRQVRLAADHRHRSRHGRDDDDPHLRSVLHDKAGGHRARLVDRVRDRETKRRLRLPVQRARPWNDVQDLLPARGGSAGRSAKARRAGFARAAARASCSSRTTLPSGRSSPRSSRGTATPCLRRRMGARRPRSPERRPDRSTCS